jgi:ATP-dependent helicase/nuclease subunit B
MAESKFAPLRHLPEFHAFLWPRVEAALLRIAAWEAGRREGISHIDVERSGALDIPLGDGTVFELRAQADRIERRTDGKLVVIDFKSGAPPTAKMVEAGFSPQLTLEAKMIERGAFAGLEPAEVAEAVYVKVLGGDAKETFVGRKGGIAVLADEHFAQLRVMLDQFRDPETGYASRPHPLSVRTWGVYDHLARVKEWSAGAGEGGEG